MFMVYWSQNVNGAIEAKNELFDSGEMSAALKFMEDLRKRTNEGIAFVGMVSENPNCVGKMGASDVEPGYNWTKRRSTALRKDVLEDERAKADAEEYDDHK